MRFFLDVRLEKPPRTLDAHRVADELSEPSADRQQPGARELVVGAAPHDDARVLRAELSADARELLLVRLLRRVDVGDAPIERGERQRRILRWGSVSARRHRAHASEGDDRGADAVRTTHTATSLRRLASAAVAPSSAPSATMPAATGHGRNDGRDTDEGRELAVESPANEQEERREEHECAQRTERALHASLDDERLLHEAVGRADELEHLDLGAASLQGHAHRRPDDREHRREHHDRQQCRRRDPAAHQARQPLGPRLVRLDVVHRGQRLHLRDHVGQLGVGHVRRDVDLDGSREGLDGQRGERRGRCADIACLAELARARRHSTRSAPPSRRARARAPDAASPPRPASRRP